MSVARILNWARSALIALVVLGPAGTAHAQSALEQVTGGGPANGAAGQTLTTLTTTLQNNTNNPTGTTFVAPGFTPTVTYTLSNQQYTLPTSIASSGVSTFFGGTTNPTNAPSIYYGPLSGIGVPANGNFTSLASVPAGTGINTTLNFGARMYIAAEGLGVNGAPLSGRIHTADLTLTFSSPVTNPVIHLSGLGGNITRTQGGVTVAVKGFSAEFEVLNLAANNITSVSRLSGNSAFVQSGNNFNNGNANPSASCSAGEGACGSVLVSGSNISQIQLRVYLRGTTVEPGASLSWSTTDRTAGDAFYVATSFELSDMQPAFSNLPSTIVPGTTSTGLTLTCTNNGPNFARGGVFCTPSVNVGTISNLVCSPALPEDITNVSPTNRAVCTFDHSLPPDSTATSVLFTGQTGAANDRIGGAVGTAGNNQVQQSLAVVPTADLAITKTNGMTSLDAGSTTTYTVRVTNNGPSTVTGAILSDPLATGLTKTAVVCSAAPGQCTAPPTVTQIEGGSFALPALASGQFYEVSITANVTATSGSVTNGATVTAPAGVTDPTGPNNSVNDTDTVTPVSDLAITKTDGLTSVGSTGTVTYTVRVTNGGPSPVTGAILSDPVATGLTKTAVACSGTPGQCITAPTVAALEGGSFALPALASGAFYEVTVTATVTATSGTVANTATIAPPAGTTDPSAANNSATDTNRVYVIDALADNFSTTPVNGASGGALASVLGNDTLDGAAVVPGQITLTPGAAPTPAAGSITMNPDGTITVAAGTTAGTYTYSYTICENLFPTNCDTASATIVVSAAPIDAVADSGTVANGANGGTAVIDVLANDTLNGVPATLATVSLAQVSTTNPNVTLNPATGAVLVAPGTPAGTYTVSYAICEILNPTNCDTTTVTTTVGAAPIDAVNNAPPAVNGFAGGTLPTVLGNDTLNGGAATVGAGGNVTLTPGTAPAPANGSISMNPDGTVAVAAGTTAGTYLYSYTICEVLNPTNCDTATVTVVVSAAPIDAVDNAPPPVNGFVGSTIPTVLGNDTLNGAPVNPAAVLLIPGVAPTPTAGAITMNPNGTITVAAGTTAGTYTYTYTICERLNPTNCDTATATVVVEPAVILAVDDDFSATPVNGFVGGAAGNVLTNDQLNGATVNPAQTTITVLDAGGIAGLVILDSGVVTVPAGTPAGTYTVEYELCEDLNLGNCDTAQITIQVNPPVIDAVDNDFTATPLNGFIGGTVGNVLTNDRLNGATVNPAQTTITVTNAGGLTGVTISDSGSVSVPAGVAAGTYTVTYRLCEDLNPTNCDTATVQVRIVAPVIDAADNNFASISGLNGGTTATVLGNDTLNGAPVNPAQITLAPGTAPAPASGSITMNPDGTITVAAGTTAGTYSYPYTICELLNPTNCDTATATVVVGLPVIDARPETVPAISGVAPPGVAMNVLTSDRIGGVQATISNVTISLISIETDAGAPYPDVTLDIATGNVVRTQPGPGGIVQITYRICDVVNPTNCDIQVETLAILPLVLEALPESYDPVNGLNGGALTVGGLPATIIDSDVVDSVAATLTPGNANSVVIPAPVPSDYTNLATGLPVTFLSLDPATGVVTVAPGTPAGTYGIFYEICDPLDLSRCDGITETVVVEPAPIVAVADNLGPVNGFTGGTTVSVLVNDTLNGVPVNLADVTLTPGAALNPVPAFGSITLNPDGTVTVAPGTSAGIYEYSYTICERLNPTNCDTAIITITLVAPAIDAVDDTPAPVSGYTGGLLPNILGNDLLNGAPLSPADVVYTPGTALGTVPAAGAITLNPDGTITVAPGTTAGSYPYSYTICDRVNPTNCDTATVTVVVTAAPIDAVDNTFAAINGRVGGSTPTVLGNDTLNGVAVVPAEITLAPGTAPTPVSGSISMNADGTITVAAGTTAGVYSFPYTICEQLNSLNCDSAVATVTVTASPIDAVDDDLSTSPVNGASGGSLATVLTNDTLNGVAVVAADVTVTPGAAPTPAAGSITMNPDGTITVAAGTTAGTYTYSYTICERLNPTNCDTATATVVVSAAPIDAVDDVGTATNGAAGGTAVPNVLTNDTLNGVAPTLATVSLSQLSTTNPNVTLNPATGAVSVAPGTPAGTYIVAYEICERLNPANCDPAIATVTVGAAPIDAVDDVGSVASGAAGGTAVPNVLTNDTLNGVAPTLATVSLSQLATTNPNVTLNPATGAVSVAPGTPAGTYTVTYEICENLNPTNCDTAVVTVTVGAAAIDAVDDTPVAINGFLGGSTATVLGNDTLGGVSFLPGAVILTPGTAPTPLAGSISMNLDGTITVAAGTSAGTYTYPYEICELLNPTNCDTANATVIVAPPALNAADDDFSATPLNGLTGGTAGNVFGNDSLNGDPIVTALITVTLTDDGGLAGALLGSTGDLTVPAGTPAGTYTLTYELCEALNPTNCDTATVTVVVDAAAIDAVDDTPDTISGLTGGSTPTVLGNDSLNGVVVDPATITLAPGTAPTPAAGSITMNSDGTITVAAGTTAGTYSYPYEICEQLNPANCDTATATVVVGAAVIDALDDAPDTVSATLGGTTPSVLGNDLLNGAVLSPAAVILTPDTAPTPVTGSITMNPDGTITVAPNTFPGTYSYSYTICEALNPTNCDTATATVTVLNPGETELVDDVSGGNIPGTPVTVRVLGNDRDPNSIFDPATLQILGTAAPGAPLVVPGEGTWSVDLASGSITFTPEPGFQGNPTPIRYRVADRSGTFLEPAFVIITYDLTPAFVCSDVIGKVFEDLNHDGFQDPGEKGIPAARLATVNGRIITTDEHGRFSVPCADIPQDIGSTFLLKLDPRSLPTGYRLTTENPRTVRLTQGMMSKMNFGVSLTNLVRIDLTDEAFDPRTGEIVTDLDNGLKALVKEVARKPSFVRLSYFVDGETTELAEDRLELVEDRLRDLWRDRGRGKLGLETTVIEKN